MVQFTPKTDEELAAEGLLPKGEYDFEVKEAEETTSKAGNDMIKVRLSVMDDEGSPHTVWDYLLESMGYKLKSFADAVGMSNDYSSGNLSASEMEGRAGRVKIDIDPEKNGYPAKNVVKSYIKAAGHSAARAPGGGARAKMPARDLDDEIPFRPCWQ